MENYGVNRMIITRSAIIGHLFDTCFILFNNYSTIFTEPEENNCFSIIAQVIIRATVFSFILLVSSLKTSRNRASVILKISASVL